MTPTQEILPAPFSKSDALAHERKADKLYETGQRTLVQFAAELARLQDGQAHLLRGFTDFGKYCESRFEGLGERNAFQMARQGRVLLVLEEAGKINIDKAENLPGTTGLRALAKILKDLGAETMIAIHDKAAEAGKVTDERVAAATAALIAPVVQELGAGKDEAESVDPDEEEDEPYGEYDEDMTEKEKELVDRIRDLSWELPESLEELSNTVKSLEREQKKQDNKEDKEWLSSGR